MASFRIHQDQENREIELRRTLKETQQTKRAVLGLLSNNNVNRNQFQKPIKQDLQDENGCVKQKSQVEIKKSHFIIHEDKANENAAARDAKSAPFATSKSNTNELPPSITTLHRPPLQDIACGQNVDPSFEDSLELSPMSVDKSIEILPIPEKTQERETDILRVEEYELDIYKYLREAETLHRPKSNYMRKQPDISYSMRSILVDWLVEVAEEYKLQAETLYLAVSYIDRFLSYMSVVRAKLQLVGTAAMFIAAKYEEIYPPDVGEFVYITDDTYTKKQVLRMEHLILKVLSFDLSAPTVLTFITTYSSSRSDMKDTPMFLAMYLTELSLLEGDPYLQFLPSVRAASAVALARHTLSLDVWPSELQEVSGYVLTELKACITYLDHTFETASTYSQQAVREKYKTNRWHNVSLLTPRSTPVC